MTAKRREILPARDSGEIFSGEVFLWRRGEFGRVGTRLCEGKDNNCEDKKICE